MPTTKYYRIRRKMYWLPEQPVIDKLESSHADYYLLVDGDRDLISRLGLEVMEYDELSGAVLARPRT
jgi:hypothetical protein